MPIIKAIYNIECLQQSDIQSNEQVYILTGIGIFVSSFPIQFFIMLHKFNG